MEVDFLLRRGREYLALEVRSSGRFSRSWLRGLKAIGELGGVVRRILVYGGSGSLKTEEGIEVWPFDVLHRRLEEGTVWP